MQIVQAICNKDVWGVAGYIIHGILQGINGFHYAEARYICRNSNKIAHELAQHPQYRERKASGLVWSLRV